MNFIIFSAIILSNIFENIGNSEIGRKSFIVLSIEVTATLLQFLEKHFVLCTNVCVQNVFMHWCAFKKQCKKYLLELY